MRHKGISRCKGTNFIEKTTHYYRSNKGDIYNLTIYNYNYNTLTSQFSI